MVGDDRVGRVVGEVQALGSPEHATVLSRFFKTGPGEYGEGDCFLGVKVPPLRKVAGHYFSLLSLDEIEQLLQRPEHELRLLALLMWVARFDRPKEGSEREEIVARYLRNTHRINNWDLVDLSVYKILGPHCGVHGADLLYRLAGSGRLWEERMAVIATLYYIRNGDYSHTLAIALQLMRHRHDLIHKAVGWMLREVGKRDFDTAYRFVKENYRSMPRTMLRYAIERYPEAVRREMMG